MTDQKFTVNIRDMEFIFTKDKLLSQNDYWDCLLAFPTIHEYFRNVNRDKIKRIYTNYPKKHPYSKKTIKFVFLYDLCLKEINSKGTKIIAK